jgi:hypothetical protein
MITHIPDAPLAHDPQTAIVDSIEAVLWDHYTGHLGHIQTIATIDAMIKEYRQ